MRTTLACLALLAGGLSVAHADKKLQDLTPGLTKEAAACQVEARGLARIVAGTRVGPDVTDKDLAAVTATNTIVVEWCAELDGIVAFLETNKDAAYKAVAKELDARYKRVAKLRKEAKASLAAAEPVMRRLIGTIKRPVSAAPEEKPAATSFPSGRKVVLPRLSGSWTVSGTGISDTATYLDKNMSATTTSRQFDSGDCEKERASLAARATASGVADLEPPMAARELGVAWSVRLQTRDAPPHSLLVMCAPQKSGGVTVTSDIAPATNKVLAAEMTKLMIEMMSAQLAPAAAAWK